MKQQLPLVSVITPVWNVEQYISETLDSILEQTYKNIEIICIDDCSPDNSKKIIKSYMEKHKNIELVELKKNSGPSVARNEGIKQAKGIYILPFDADDLMKSTYVEKAVNILQKDTKEEIGVVYCEEEFFGGRSGKRQQLEYSKKRILVKNMVHQAGMFRKKHWEQYGGFDAGLIHGLEDWDFWLNFVENDKDFYCIKEVLRSYRISQNTRSTRLDQGDRKSATIKQIRKNHPKLYNFNNYISNRYLRKKLLSSIGKWILQTRLRKKKKIIRVLGIYLIKKEK